MPKKMKVFINASEDEINKWLVKNPVNILFICQSQSGSPDIDGNSNLTISFLYEC